MDDRLALTRIAQWWTQATNEARFQALQKAIHGDPQAPPLQTLQLAIILAEVEAGEVGEG